MLNKLSNCTARLIRGFLLRKTALTIFLVTLAVAIVMLFTFRNTVVIHEGDSSFTFRTMSTDASAILMAAGVDVDDSDQVITLKNGGITEITINRLFDVAVTVGDKTTVVKIPSGTVSDALEQAGVSHDQDDMINYDLDYPLSAGLIIDVIPVDYLYETLSESVPKNSETVYSSAIAKGKTTVTEGADGVKLVTYCKKLVNGVVTETTLVSEELVTEPVNSTQTVGTKAVSTSDKVACISEIEPSTPIELDVSGRPISYSKVVTGSGTAYYTGTKTSTGVAPRPGYIAVDPKVIPYGSKLYIVSTDGKYVYGYAIAADTGGFVNYNNNTVADLFFNTRSECINFGRRQVEIYVLN
ncbi:MAG: 3D domain-containing protein [Oscillospiraceae bacterium]|nr:3D domain-containing protein [Oscillospiraceae bacterium]